MAVEAGTKVVELIIELVSRLMPNWGIIFTVDGSTRWRFEGSKESFRPPRMADGALLTLKELSGGDWVFEEGEGPRLASPEPEVGCLWPFGGHPPQLAFFGIATLTAAPQAHGFPCKQGQLARGRPGFLTVTMMRSSPWLHFVDRWPRMHGALPDVHVSDTHQAHLRRNQISEKLSSTKMPKEVINEGGTGEL